MNPVDDGRMAWHVDVKWPDGLREGKAKVFYADEHIDDIKITRWRNTVSLRSAVDDYFDRQRKNL
jgi:hypothetical protein